MLLARCAGRACSAKQLLVQAGRSRCVTVEAMAPAAQRDRHRPQSRRPTKGWSAMSETRIHSIDFLEESRSSSHCNSSSSDCNSNHSDESSSCTALIILNHNLPQRTSSFWRKARLHLCADGGANRLYNEFPSRQERFIPEYIVGDLDSIQPSIRDFYSSKGAKILDKSGDQDTTDLHKCVAFLRDSMPHHERQQLEILVLGALGGRFDHEMGNLNVLYVFRDTKIVLLSDENLIFLLPSGTLHELKASPGAHCGLIPLGSASKNTTTTGLRWNLNSMPMAFGSLVSTSNVVEDETVTVVSDVDLLWTMELKDGKRDDDDSLA